MPSSSRKKIVYQILVRLFGNKKTSFVFNGTIEENGVGKFNDINENALMSLKELGVTDIYFTGIIEHATMSDFTTYGIQPDDWRLVKGRAGSPFAIKDYFDVSPELAVKVTDRMKEFEALVKRTHQQGMNVIIDFIPNHVARSYHSDSEEGKKYFFGNNDDETKAFDPQNNFYYITDQSFSPPANYQPLGIANFPLHQKSYIEFPARVTGNNVLSATPSTDDWFETVKLNFGVNIFNGHATYFDPVPKTWIYLKEVILFWAGKGVNGFRCDMAEMVPVEFWKWLITAVKESYPLVFFIGEIYKKEQYADYIHEGCFDYLYDKAGLYDQLYKMMKGEGYAKEITHHVEHVAKFRERMLNFIENHDELRIASQHAFNNPLVAIPAMTLSATVSKGPVMIYFGQEVGAKADVQVGFGGGNGRTTIYDYYCMPELQKWMNDGLFDGGLLNKEQQLLRSFYHQLLKACNQYDALREGELYILNEEITAQDVALTNKNIYGFIRHTVEQCLLVLLNFSLDQELSINFNMKKEKWKLVSGLQNNNFHFQNIFDQTTAVLQLADTEYIFKDDFQLMLPPSSSFIYLIE